MIAEATIMSELVSVAFPVSFKETEAAIVSDCVSKADPASLKET